MLKPNYCTREQEGSCENCPLSNNGKDCRNIPYFLSEAEKDYFESLGKELDDLVNLPESDFISWCATCDNTFLIEMRNIVSMRAMQAESVKNDLLSILKNPKTPEKTKAEILETVKPLYSHLLLHLDKTTLFNKVLQERGVDLTETQ